MQFCIPIFFLLSTFGEATMVRRYTFAAVDSWPTRISSPIKMAVSKGDLVDAIAARAGVSKKMAGAVLTSVLDVIVESVANGDKAAAQSISVEAQCLLQQACRCRCR